MPTGRNSSTSFDRMVHALSVIGRRLRRDVRSNARAIPVVPPTPRFWSTVLFFVAALTLLLVVFDDDIAQLAKTRPQSVDAFFQRLTVLGTSGWILVLSGIGGLALSALDFNRLNRRMRVRAAALHADLTFVFVCVAGTGIAANLIKNTIGRARPKYLETLGHLEFHFAAFDSSFASFPSGHSTTFGAFCMALVLLVPSGRWFWLALALAGGLSRIVVGAHFPADVVAGLAFGAGLTLLAARWLGRRAVMFTLEPGKWLPKRRRSGFRSHTGPGTMLQLGRALLGGR